MRPLAAIGLSLFFLGWLTVACQSFIKTATPMPPSVTAAAEPSPTYVPVTIQIPTPTRIPLTPSHTQTPTPTLVPLTRTPTPTPGPLTDIEAVALVKEELANRGVSLDTVRITIAGKPRRMSIRYASSYTVDSNVFKAQTVLVALAAARVVVRIHPSIDGGMQLGVMPAGESDVGLQVTVIEGSSLAAWASGSLTDQEFVSQWSGGIVTRE